MMRVAIVTPTYNRVELLERLYNSIKNQDNRMDFEWLIIDDGSTDNTKYYVQKWIGEKFLPIHYVFQTNSGKAAALNTAFAYNDYYDFFLIVDSDDFLLPTAFEKIRYFSEKFCEDNQIGALFFRYQDENGDVLRSPIDHVKIDIISTRSEHDEKFGKYDGCVGYYRRVTEKFKYPFFEGEKYIGPTVLQLLMEDKYKIVFLKDIIGVAEYQAAGLTDAGRFLRVKNPNGMRIYYLLNIKKSSKIFTKIKYSIAYNIYSNISDSSYLNISIGLKEKIIISLTKPIGYIGHFYFKKKYHKD